MGAGGPGGRPAPGAVEALPGAALPQLVLLPRGGAQGLAGRAATAGLLHAGAGGAAALAGVQHADQLRPAAVQDAEEASLPGHLLPLGDDRAASGHHAGVLCVLGAIAGG